MPTSAAMFGAEQLQLRLNLPEPYVPCNPSVHFDGMQWRCAVRTVDYRLGVIANDGSSSVNYLLELNRRLSIDECFTMHDDSGIEKNPWARVRGYEDLRLFGSPFITGDRYPDGKLGALATACDLAGGGFRPELVRLAIGKRGAITEVTPLRGPWSYMPQKNWTPVLDRRNRVLYRVIPRLTIEWRGGRLVIETDERAPGFAPASVRGGSQAIPFDGGWLCVVHEHASHKPTVYSHRFIWMDDDLEARKFTPAFSWQGKPVEFCAGLATDGARLVASYGVHDAEAWLAVIAPDAVRARLVAF